MKATNGSSVSKQAPWEKAGFASRSDWRKARNRNEIPANEEDPSLQLQKAIKLREEANAQESEAVRRALEMVGGNVRRAADVLQIPHRTLDGWLRVGRLQDLHKLTSRIPGRPPAVKSA